MPICIECRYPVPQLYHVLHSTSKPAPSTTTTSKVASSTTPSLSSTPINGGSRGGGESSVKSGSGGGDVRLTQCPRCKRFADKYVEHDFVVIFIDLVLVKPQVYRHLLFNRLGGGENAFDPSIVRLGFILLLFDVYLTWASIEALPDHFTSGSLIPHLPILVQYAFYFLLSFLTTLSQHLAVRTAAKWSIFQPASPALTVPPTPNTPASTPFFGGTPAMSQMGGASTPLHTPSVGAHSYGGQKSTTASPTAISTALFVSSCMKLFPILMVVWRYEDAGGQVARGVSWAVAAQNVEALRILLGTTYWKSTVLVMLGKLASSFVERCLLGMFGLSGVRV